MTANALTQKSKLAKFLSWGKIHLTINELVNNKAVGLDRVPMELWKRMSASYDVSSRVDMNPYCDIVGMMRKVFNNIKKFRIDPTTKFNKGWMCLIYKKGERNNITNYRPITVLNTDYKIMTKSLANKLAEVTPSIIH